MRIYQYTRADPPKYVHGGDPNLNTNILVRLFTRVITQAKAEMEHSSDDQTSAMLKHTLTPFIQGLTAIRAHCFRGGETGAENSVERISNYLKSLDPHMYQRLVTNASEDELAALEAFKKTEPTVSTEGHVPMTTQFNLLKSISPSILEAKVATELQAAEQSQGDDVNVPDSVRKSLDARIKTLTSHLEAEKKKGVKDWAYSVPVATPEPGDQFRLAVQTDKAIELLEMIREYLSKDKVSYREVKIMIGRVFSYDNLTRLNIPDDVVKFIHAGVAFNKWYANKQEYKPVVAPTKTQD